MGISSYKRSSKVASKQEYDSTVVGLSTKLNSNFSNLSGSVSLPSGTLFENEESPIFISLDPAGTETNQYSYSTDGITWTTLIMPSSKSWFRVTQGNGKFVAITADTINRNSNFSAYSTDAITWTERPLPAASVAWLGLAYGNGIYLTTGGATSTTVAASSTDGITWTQRTMPASLSWNNLIYAKNTFVALAAAGTSAVSTDGITWTSGTLPTGSLWFSLAYGNGIFVAANYNSTVGASSTDGITWTQRTMPWYANWISIVYAKNKFVAISRSPMGNSAISTNGINWTGYTLPIGSYGDMAYGNGKFVLAAGNPTKLYSTDGITWTQRTMPSGSYEYSVYGRSKQNIKIKDFNKIFDK
jgi:hypothetical protein